MLFLSVSRTPPKDSPQTITNSLYCFYYRHHNLEYIQNNVKCCLRYFCKLMHPCLYFFHQVSLVIAQRTRWILETFLPSVFLCKPLFFYKVADQWINFR